jgi:predicted ATP-dependent serine protease
MFPEGTIYNVCVKCLTRAHLFNGRCKKCGRWPNA